MQGEGELGDYRGPAVLEETQFSSINAQLPANNVITGAFKSLPDAYELPLHRLLHSINASSSSIFFFSLSLRRHRIVIGHF